MRPVVPAASFAGAKVKDVAAQFGVRERTVYRWLATWYQHGVLKLPRMGRRKKMSAAAQEVLVRELDLMVVVVSHGPPGLGRAGVGVGVGVGVGRRGCCHLPPPGI